MSPEISKGMEVENIAELPQVLSSDLLERLQTGDVLLLVSGGSMLKDGSPVFSALDNLLASIPVNGHKLTISLVDERWDYEPNHASSNWVAFMGADIYQKLSDHPQIDLKPVLTKEYKDGFNVDAGLAETAADFEAFLKQFPPAQTVGLFGLGGDGHTAGIMLHDKVDANLFDINGVVGFDLGKLRLPDVNPEKLRITPGFGYLRRIADNSYLVLTGDSDDKRTQLAKLVSGTNQGLNEFPAGVFAGTGIRVYASPELMK